MNFKGRQRRAVRTMGGAAEGLLVTYLPDVRYLTGFTGSNAALVLVGGRAVLFTDGRYTAQVRAEAVGTKAVIATKPAVAAALEWMEAAGVSRCGFDGTQTTVAGLEGRRKLLSKTLGAKARRRFLWIRGLWWRGCGR